MKTAQYTDEDVLVAKAIDALMRELGPVDTLRFVTMPKKKRMDSVRRHREWQKTLSKDDFFKVVFEH
jgi:hypothetical protein